MNRTILDAIRHAAILDAIRHADYMLATYGEHRAVWVVPGPDQYGRTDVVFVRHPADPEMEGLVEAGQARTVYNATEERC